MSPTQAASAQEAMELLQADKKFDLALVDMHMSGMNGVDFAHKVKALHPNRQMPLILLTSLGERAVAMRKQFDAILTKPVKPSQLYNVLLNTLTKSKNADHMVTTQPKPSIKNTSCFVEYFTCRRQSH